jgi:hypothetical protein
MDGIIKREQNGDLLFSSVCDRLHNLVQMEPLALLRRERGEEKRKEKERKIA